MNNNLDDKDLEKEEENNTPNNKNNINDKIKIDIFEESDEDFIENLTKNKNVKALKIEFPSPISNDFFIELIVELVIFVILSFTFSTLFNSYEISLLNELLIFIISFIPCFIIHYFLKKKYMMLYILSLGSFEFIVNFLFFVIVILVTKKLIVFGFDNTLMIYISFIFSYIGYKFILKYISKKLLLKKSKKNGK